MRATNVMRRKAGAGRPAPEIRRMTTARAWKLSMPRAAEDTLAVQAAILKVEESRVVRDALPPLVTGHALITLLEGPEERFGVAIIDAPVLSGMIEAATTGRVASRPAIPREPTRTDAIISADLVDALLERFEGHLAEMDDAPNLAGYRFAAPLVDGRAIEMALAEGPYSLFRLTVDLGGGVRQGEIVAAFPVAPRGAGRGVDVAAFQKALAENVMGAPSELDAVLVRLQKPLSEITKLAPGDVLRVPLAALVAVEVEAGSGRGVARARLGQQGGFRAVRITQLAGSESAETAELAEFEEAAPSPSRAVLPLGGPMPGGVEGDDLPPLDDAFEFAVPPVPGDLDLPDLPPLE